MLMASVENGHSLWLVIAAVIFAAISAYYYFRVIQAIYFKPAGAQVISKEDISPAFNILLVISALLVILLGIYPEILIQWLYH
jgi:NADH-quinone oxidoreductase subunit N